MRERKREGGIKRAREKKILYEDDLFNYSWPGPPSGVDGRLDGKPNCLYILYTYVRRELLKTDRKLENRRTIHINMAYSHI